MGLKRISPILNENLVLALLISSNPVLRRKSRRHFSIAYSVLYVKLNYCKMLLHFIHSIHSIAFISAVEVLREAGSNFPGPWNLGLFSELQPQLEGNHPRRVIAS